MINKHRNDFDTVTNRDDVHSYFENIEHIHARTLFRDKNVTLMFDKIQDILNLSYDVIFVAPYLFASKHLETFSFYYNKMCTLIIILNIDQLKLDTSNNNLNYNVLDYAEFKDFISYKQLNLDNDYKLSSNRTILTLPMLQEKLRFYVIDGNKAMNKSSFYDKNNFTYVTYPFYNLTIKYFYDSYSFVLFHLRQIEDFILNQNVVKNKKAIKLELQCLNTSYEYLLNHVAKIRHQFHDDV